MKLFTLQVLGALLWQRASAHCRQNKTNKKKNGEASISLNVNGIVSSCREDDSAENRPLFEIVLFSKRLTPRPPPAAGWCEVNVHGNVENPTRDEMNVPKPQRSSSHLLLTAVNSSSVDCI